MNSVADTSPIAKHDLPLIVLILFCALYLFEREKAYRRKVREIVDSMAPVLGGGDGPHS